MDAAKFMLDWFTPIWLMIVLTEVVILLGNDLKNK